jgi:hypothetical protein
MRHRCYRHGNCATRCSGTSTMLEGPARSTPNLFQAGAEAQTDVSAMYITKRIGRQRSCADPAAIGPQCSDGYGADNFVTPSTEPTILLGVCCRWLSLPVSIGRCLHKVMHFLHLNKCKKHRLALCKKSASLSRLALRPGPCHDRVIGDQCKACTPNQRAAGPAAATGKNSQQ